MYVVLVQTIRFITSPNSLFAIHFVVRRIVCFVLLLDVVFVLYCNKMHTEMRVIMNNRSGKLLARHTVFIKNVFCLLLSLSKRNEFRFEWQVTLGPGKKCQFSFHIKIKFFSSRIMSWRVCVYMSGRKPRKDRRYTGERENGKEKIETECIRRKGSLTTLVRMYSIRTYTKFVFSTLFI